MYATTSKANGLGDAFGLLDLAARLRDRELPKNKD
jgi:hypothetical protein